MRSTVNSICLGVQRLRECRYRWSLTVLPRWIDGCRPIFSNSTRIRPNSSGSVVANSFSRSKSIQFNLGSGSVPLKSSVNNLGVIFDGQLSMREHVRHVCRSSYYQLRQLRVVRGSLTFKASAQLVHVFINIRQQQSACRGK